MQPKKRKIAFYSFSIKPSIASRKHAGEQHPEVPFAKHGAIFKCMLDVLVEKPKLKDKKQNIEIVDVNSKDDFIVVLLNFTSNDYSDPTYINSSTRERRPVVREDDESMEFSCHLLISRRCKDLFYRIYIERTPGLYRQRVMSFFNELIRLAKQKNPDVFSFPHPDGSTDDNGNARMLKLRASCDIEGVPSAELVEAFEKGVIDGLYITTRKIRSQFDEALVVEEKEAKISYEVNAKKGERYARLKEFCLRTKRENPDVSSGYISFRRDYSSPEGSEKLKINFDDNVDDPLACDYFTRMVPIDVEVDHTSYDKIRPAIEAQLIRLARNE